jgi:WD40 repeat protein
MDSTMVVSGHFDGTLRFWDLRSGKLSNEVTGLHTQQITSVAVGSRSGLCQAFKDGFTTNLETRYLPVDSPVAERDSGAFMACRSHYGSMRYNFSSRILSVNFSGF